MKPTLLRQWLICPLIGIILIGLLFNSQSSRNIRMRNIVGQTPRGNDFFPRDNVVQKIYKKLETGHHIYLAAPRRVGKTAIFRHLEDNPREHYEFKYLITESINNPLVYFKQLSESLYSLKSLLTLRTKDQTRYPRSHE